MALTLGITGMDASTEADVQAAFKMANADTGNRWTLVDGDSADYVVIDMDSLYGPMSWLRLHSSGRKVIGLTAVDRNQTDYRLPRPVSASDFSVLLSEIATDPPVSERTPRPEPAVESSPAPQPAAPVVAPVAEPEATPVPPVASPAAPEPPPEPTPPTPAPVAELAPERSLAQWLRNGGLERRVRLQRGDGPVLLVDPRSGVWHGPAALKPLQAYFEGVLEAEDFATPDAAAWEGEAASLGAAQPLARLQWLGGLVSGHGSLLPGFDPEVQYRLLKWPQTEREYPKHFRIATAMMKGPATLDEVAAASGVGKDEVADFVNANLATGYAEPAVEAPPESTTPAPKGGLFGRMRGR